MNGTKDVKDAFGVKLGWVKKEEVPLVVCVNFH